MFKKLKDKIAEEVKISPKLQASVQHFAQAMVSPSSSISSMQESTSNDNFSIVEESEVSETPRNSPEKDNNSFQRIDLREDVISTPPRFPPSRSRRSSASSMMSDVSSLFPAYESPNNAYHFQSDLESTSEIDDITGSTSHLQSISKEQLLLAYRKTQSRYHKYKGRYVDLARHFKELERQNGKIKVVLTETQDRALRKIAELKEQCALEQKAKAHLEDALRNDLEEKDHLIDTLKTKMELEAQRKREEEAALSLAENKMQVHRELESREEEAKKLKAIVAKLQEELRNHKKGGGVESAPSASSADGTANVPIEDSGAGGDGLPLSFPPTSELMQLKEVLRSKYREVEVLAAENGKLRASLLLAKCRPSSSGIILEEDESSQHPRESSLDEVLRGGGKDLIDGFENWMDEMVSLEHSDSENFLQKVESKDASDLEVSDSISNLNGRESGESFLVRQHFKGDVGAARVLGEPSLEKRWELKCGEMRGELDRLLKVEEEMRELLALNTSPLESAECSDDGYRANESNVSLVESLTSVLGEKRKLKEDLNATNTKLKGVVKDCEEMKGLLDMLNSEKKVLTQELKHSKEEVNGLRKNVEELQQVTKELQRTKTDGEDLVIKFEEISKEYESLKSELDRFHAESEMEREHLKTMYAAEVSLALGTLEGKEVELQQVRAQLQSASCIAEDQKRKGENDLLIKCHHLEGELLAERERRLLAENSMNTFQNGLCKEFVGVLGDGRSILHEALKSVSSLEQEVDRLKAQCEGFHLQEEETKKIIKELKETQNQQLERLQEEEGRTRAQLESAIVERDEAKRKLKEELQRAAVTVTEMEALMLKRHESESRALKAENDLKVVREMEEKAKVEAEEATHEQAAMRRSWEMQREQIESMSREIEGLKKAEGGLIKTLKEVRDEVKNKEMEVKRMLEESSKERKGYSQSEEKLRAEISNLKKLTDEFSAREEQTKKELEKMKEIANEWKSKGETWQKELEVSGQEKRNLKKNLDSKEVEATKNSEAVEILTKELGVSAKKEKELKLGLTALTQEVDSLKSLMSTKVEELENLKRENKELSVAKADFESQVKALGSEKDKLHEREMGLMEEVRKLQTETEISEQLLKNTKADLEKQEGYGRDLQERLKVSEGAELERRNLEELLAERAKEVDWMRVELEGVSEVNRKLREELEQARLSITNLKDSMVERGENEGRMDSAEQTLRAERDDAMKRASAADERIRSLEGELGLMSEGWAIERKGLEEKVRRCEEELRLRVEGVGGEENMDRVREELRDMVVLKESLEKSLSVAQKEALEKADWERRAKELECVVEEIRRDFDVTVANQDESHQEELSSYSEKMEAEVDYIRRQLMTEINGLRQELILKGNECDQLLEDHNKIVNEREFELENMKRDLTTEREKANQIIENETSKWMSKISELEEKHNETVEALKLQWEAEKRELEITSKVAVAAVESGTGSMSYLKRQIQAQSRELSETKRKYSSEILELRHLLSLQKRPHLIDSERSTLDDSTELEYLRNILYEYMMGKEPMVLARVIAAVVKFDDEQTKKILIKEEQKQTLLGQFGLT
ncbi:golgin subfamily A member 4-like isoform X2 [Hetaerina americana]|uniref:golgin subfamily A member 4-like isoform X2 n=1 Tax=Hetaerina americana TaxID=62018 RepID=UPI003A7F30B6